MLLNIRDKPYTYFEISNVFDFKEGFAKRNINILPLNNIEECYKTVKYIEGNHDLLLQNIPKIPVTYVFETVSNILELLKHDENTYTLLFKVWLIDRQTK